MPHCPVLSSLPLSSRWLASPTKFIGSITEVALRSSPHWASPHSRHLTGLGVCYPLVVRAERREPHSEPRSAVVKVVNVALKTAEEEDVEEEPARTYDVLRGWSGGSRRLSPRASTSMQVTLNAGGGAAVVTPFSSAPLPLPRAILHDDFDAPSRTGTLVF